MSVRNRKTTEENEKKLISKMSEPKLKFSDLPLSAQAIADVIGVEATLRLSEAFGAVGAQGRGRKRHGKLYVPTVECLCADHRIVDTIGLEAAIRLAMYFGGDDIPVPRCRFAAKRAAVWADFMADMPIPDIAAKHQISERRVRQITAEERAFNRSEHSRAIGQKKTRAKTATARRYGTLGGTKNTMLKNILATFKSEPTTPYGTLYASLRAFSPKLTLLLTEDQAAEIALERAVELMVPCLPAELTVKHGDLASLLVLTPAKTAQRREPLMIRVETPLTAKAMSQNAVVIYMLEALAVSAVIDKLSAYSGQPKPSEARN